MKKIAVLSIILTLSFPIWAQIKVTKGQALGLKKDSYVFIDGLSSEEKQLIIAKYAFDNNYLVFYNNDSSGLSPLIITKKSKGMVRDNAPVDCLLGVGSCLLGIGYINVAGETGIPSGGGFYASAGDKYVEGGEAAFVGGTWLLGCVFGVKGIFELFKPDPVQRYAGKYIELVST